MSAPTSPTIGSFLFDYLHKQGVTHAFGIPGDFALPTFRWLENSPIDLITLTHEPSVGFAADAYARVTSLRPELAEAHAGLGYMRALTGQPEAAARHWEEALRLKPDFPGLRERLHRIRAGTAAK